ncbi:uncharacterized protein LOC129611428 isoform X2 [Condylostylus longicornis]|uniref:uncharacterized protein LOC129611428 isoform X2 n=1 Tax=Condylostylus longicornis TaxID=2530218 RepID=UPI00244DF192|nr:uncharacterized protein LOC129611428 isoform X2 [Condylostylus longicornis]
MCMLKYLNWNILIVVVIILSNGLELCNAKPTQIDENNDTTLDLNSEDTLRKLEALIETVRKIRADGGATIDIFESSTNQASEIVTVTPIQESSTADATTTQAPTTRITTTTTEETNLADLESSFGGLGNVREIKKPEKVNGFYFLADVNSFLEVGDGDEKVVIRYNPKIGNPSNFIPIPGTRT